MKHYGKDYTIKHTLQAWPAPMYMGTLWYGGRMFVWKKRVWGSNINKEQWCIHMKTLQYSPLFSMLTLKNVLEKVKKIVNCKKAKIGASITCRSHATVMCTHTPHSFPPGTVFKNLWEMNEELLSAGGYARLPSTRSPEAWEFSRPCQVCAF